MTCSTDSYGNCRSSDSLTAKKLEIEFFAHLFSMEMRVQGFHLEYEQYNYTGTGTGQKEEMIELK